MIRRIRYVFALAALFLAVAGPLRAADMTPPEVTGSGPAPGPVGFFVQVTVFFSEEVTGVDASDFLLNGVPADGLDGGIDTYTFMFLETPAPIGGIIHASWSLTNGIMDLDGNPFDGTAPGAQWDYITDTAPLIIERIPVPGPVTDLTNIMVRFSEPVTNVDASDLLIGGAPATTVSSVGTAGDTYLFTFPPPPLSGGNIHVSFSPTNGIRDLTGNPFDASLASAQWNYTLPDILPPLVTAVFPPPGSTVRPLTDIQVTFSKAVTNVNAGDLLLNGRPAKNVIAITNSVYVFQFNPARAGKAQVAWAGGNGITDLSSRPFVPGDPWSYFVDVTPYSILVSPNSSNVVVAYSNRFFTGVCTIEAREGTRWVPLKNFFATQRVDEVTVPLPTNHYSQLRLRCLEINPKVSAVQAFSHLALAYGNIHTIAGNGGPPPVETGTNWLRKYEGTNATEVPLSDPTFAVADEAGNVFVADRGTHAVLKITTDGRIHTVAGTHVPGLEGDIPLKGTNTPLHSPTTLHVIGNNLYILDSGNSRVRLLDSSGNLSLVIAPDPNLATNLSGLWVLLKNGEPDEIFYGAGTALRHWQRKDNLVATNADGFMRIANVVVNPAERTIVTDPLDHRVFRVRGGGEKSVVAGTGFPHGPRGNNADEVPFTGVSGIWYLPIGGYFLGLDEGAQVWYVDSDDNASPFIFGTPGTHDGDEGWFRAGGKRKPKISNVRSVTVAPSGDIILVEANGFVRKIDFVRHLP